MKWRPSFQLDLNLDVLFVCGFAAYSYARDFADPYLGHGIGPVPGYGVMFHFYFFYIYIYIYYIINSTYYNIDNYRCLNNIYRKLNIIIMYILIGFSFGQLTANYRKIQEIFKRSKLRN